MNKKILIVEDEKRLAELLSDYLKNAGFQTELIHDGLEVTDFVKKENPNLILLDLMLPGKDGLEIAKELRAFSDIPIIMITAKVEEIDRLLGLELGADDYICKPFSFREVVARVKTVLRRVNGNEKKQTSKIVTIDESRGYAEIAGKELDLTTIELKLLKVMSDNPGIIFSRENLMNNIYTDDRIVSDRTIDSHVKKLRKKISSVFPSMEIIKSIYSVGYKFEESDLK
ncbi:MAG: response regulator [Deltaproteobacteria bacterium]|nr:response regulator [Deltaproteobacteria bacterium]